MARLSKTQFEALQAAADGRLVRSHGGQFPQTYISLWEETPGLRERVVRVATLEALSGLVELGPVVSPGSRIRRYRLTDAGRTALDMEAA